MPRYLTTAEFEQLVRERVRVFPPRRDLKANAITPAQREFNRSWSLRCWADPGYRSCNLRGRKRARS